MWNMPMINRRLGKKSELLVVVPAKRGYSPIHGLKGDGLWNYRALLVIKTPSHQPCPPAQPRFSSFQDHSLYS